MLREQRNLILKHLQWIEEGIASEKPNSFENPPFPKPPDPSPGPRASEPTSVLHCLKNSILIKIASKIRPVRSESKPAVIA